MPGNYYEELGVPPNATDAEIRQAFRRRAMGDHPDHGGDPERMKHWTTILDTLTKHRAEYDATLAREAEPPFEAWEGPEPDPDPSEPERAHDQPKPNVTPEAMAHMARLAEILRTSRPKPLWFEVLWRLLVVVAALPALAHGLVPGRLGRQGWMLSLVLVPTLWWIAAQIQRLRRYRDDYAEVAASLEAARSRVAGGTASGME